MKKLQIRKYVGKMIINEMDRDMEINMTVKVKC